MASIPSAQVVCSTRRGATSATARATCSTASASAYESVDITGDDSLEERYREWLPVVEIDGARAFVYYVDEAALRRKLSQT